MDRKELLSALGMGTASFALINCLGCSKSRNASPSGTTGSSTVDFTLDLNAAANTALAANGGYLITNGVMVARTEAGTYIAVQRSCTHENYTLTYQATNERFYCANHSATFSESGALTHGSASRALTTYNTSLSCTLLRVYS